MADSSGEETTDMKQKFREALDRKNDSAKKGQSHEDLHSNVHETKPASRKRQFRRKTG